MADIGGLVARGDGTAAGKPKEVFGGPRLKPRFGRAEVGGGGLAREPAGAGVIGAVPLLNSAQRGHFRFVSTSEMSWHGNATRPRSDTYSCVPSVHNVRNVSETDRMFKPLIS